MKFCNTCCGRVNGSRRGREELGGRAYLYEARLSADEARWKAVEKIVEGFFDGSPDALAAHLATKGSVAPQFLSAAPAPVDAPVTSVAESQTQNLDETLL